jgi:hypothetical protein
MLDDDDLRRFTTWIVTQPEYEDSGFVVSANDHWSKTKTVLWAGPSTAFLAKIVKEADVRGIGLAIRKVKYSRADLSRGCEAIFDAKATLMAIGFHLSAVACTNLAHDGLTVEGFDPRTPADELDDRLVRAVHLALSQIPDLRSSIDLADVRIAYGKHVLL